MEYTGSKWNMNGTRRKPGTTCKPHETSRNKLNKLGKCLMNWDELEQNEIAWKKMNKVEQLGTRWKKNKKQKSLKEVGTS